LSLRGSLGIFGGTFSPPHCAHLRVAEEALAQCGLASVVFVPSGIPPHKPEEIVDKEHRYRMVQRMVEGHPRMTVSRIEIDREGPSYTIDTIEAFKASVGDALCFLVGADLLLDITTWRRPNELLHSVPFVLAPRNGVARERFEEPPFDEASLRFLDMEEVDLSSTWIRDRIARGEPYDPWVPSAVAAYIEKHRLYKDRERTVGSPVTGG
jgi:nicotinate-nucleotide adenylyltransferase